MQPGRRKMIVYLGRAAVAATVTEDDAPYGEAGVDRIEERSIMENEAMRRRLPPVFFKNDFGVVTNRRQFKEFYRYELDSGQPIGPHVFAPR